MCYVCSPKCDNCYPKVVVCPGCGFPCQLGMDACPECHETLSQEDKDRAVDDWKHGKRFLAKNGGEPPSFAVEMKKRMDMERERGRENTD